MRQSFCLVLAPDLFKVKCLSSRTMFVNTVEKYLKTENFFLIISPSTPPFLQHVESVASPSLQKSKFKDMSKMFMKRKMILQ